MNLSIHTAPDVPDEPSDELEKRFHGSAIFNFENACSIGLRLGE
jgi:hypothetical protein